MSEFQQTTDSYEAMVQEAINFSGQDHDHFTRVKAQCLLDITQRLLGPVADQHFLDIGCGIGLTDAHLCEHVGQLTGVEMHPDIVAKAQERNPTATYYAYDGSRLPLDDASVDLAFTICVMHHVPPAQWNHFCAEAYRVVRPGGLFVVFEHNPWNPLTQWVVSRVPFDADAVLLSAWRTLQLQRKAGFFPLERRHILFTPWAGKLWSQVDKLLGRTNIGAQYYAAARKPDSPR
ncbi:class I SAM-dependent methyltransferase [Cerasicoccus frondis]|uniref:class I SAM-dependent methyltransferase n=1 Tax=Cerasicoccus frondis TaxID=490090 RepID=UPI002852CD3B|nr:class I SAM-dependent methyltransferase [Cerasicoccus frondis]